MENITEQNQFSSIPVGTTNGIVNGFKILASDKYTSIQEFDNRFMHSGVEQDSSSGTDRDYQDPSVSDCESGISGSNNEEIQSVDNGLIKVDEGERLYETVNRRLISGLGNLGVNTKVEAIYRNPFSGFTNQARFQSFCIFERAMRRKCGGDANVKYAWYGGSKDEISRIISHGFGHCDKAESNHSYGCGVYLSSVDSPIER